MKRRTVSTKEIAYTGLMTALLLGGQFALSAISGVEVVTVLLLTFSYVFGARAGVTAATAFSLLRCLLFGFFPNVVILYLIYYNVFALFFGMLGHRKDPPAWIAPVLFAVLAVSCAVVAAVGIPVDFFRRRISDLAWTLSGLFAGLLVWDVALIWFGKGKKLRRTVTLTAFAAAFTVGFTLLDDVISPLWYGYSAEAAIAYFYSSFLAMLPQTVCAVCTVFLLFPPLEGIARTAIGAKNRVEIMDETKKICYNKCILKAEVGNMAKDQQFVSQIADIETDFPQWYSDVVLKTKLVDYGPVKGTMVIRPYGYAIWENIQRELDARFRATGHENAYFPLLIPMSFMKKEAEHVEGFAPEVAVVTHAGGEKLQEPLCIRPTSETIIGSMYSKWIQSYRDLPVLLNQWANVMRWEKTTRPFLRTSEFLWQEGHTVHASEEEAMEETMKMMSVYEEFARTCLSMPVLTGRKTAKEKFAGAVATFGMEAMMHDGKSLQAGTTHYLGQNFAKAFEIKFLDKDGVQKYGYTTSFGCSTRLIGAIIMTHGDARGLVLPPVVAPVQAIIVPIAAKKEGVLEACRTLCGRLKEAGIRAQVDDSDNSPGWKFNEWEMKGVPVRIELGPRDLEAGKIMIARRDGFEKTELAIDSAAEGVREILKDIGENLYKKAKERMDSRIVRAESLDGLLKGVEGGNFVRAGWCGCRECEDKVKEFAQATARVLDGENSFQTCVVCGKPANSTVIFARAY